MSDLGEESCLRLNRYAISHGSTIDWESGDFFKQVRKPSARKREEYVDFLFGRYSGHPEEERQTAYVQIEYDAANAYGTPIRSVQVCRFGPIGSDGAFDREAMFEQSLDGHAR